MPVPIYKGMTVNDICPKQHGIYGQHRGGAKDDERCLCLACKGCVEFICDCGTRQHVKESELVMPQRYGKSYNTWTYPYNTWEFTCAGCKTRQLVDLT